ncbi:LLM class flavin-dependent oxidoreductase [Conexibacter sp. JD483]|uniref:LLM class flavin-dependent oxidoreductase n=1 Tax=unclassified Conexibacter TaxID=2627773 RepID=UPI00271E58BD|nr:MULTISPECIES: LLM class flavin-dependent oxidoreductase [unclassified Conexibacter]MDO8186624.1 LLM class flavin-dependent oxidoreductase [Conexibacter sp. CPCC 205706]MDO8196729.1 LLM class flavin-dependent oxidoreductase [Conexibacter sp. CPCC 205762]MDR9370904.1 LLM class flavin-dependent oxidoreductase [Conexibacter sp. JD483]
MTPPLSVLDLVPVMAGSTPREALLHSADLARHAERLGYTRYWVAEHHNMTGIASAATSVVIGHLAAATETIRVGSGGIMLPNHSPLVIAEQFGTLDALFPGRIDLGLGRAPGTDQTTVRALRREVTAAAAFPQDVKELQALLGPLQPGQRIQAFPGTGSEVPLWILGSSTFGAQLAAMLGLPYAFASHFAPTELHAALDTYRGTFQPSDQLAKPYAMVGLNVVAADSDAEARRLFTTVQQGFTNLFRGRPGPYQPPIDDIEAYWSPLEKAQASRMLAYSIVGGPETVREGLERVVEETGADELMVVSAIHDQQARQRSYELLAEAAGGLTPDRQAAGVGPGR